MIKVLYEGINIGLCEAPLNTALSTTYTLMCAISQVAESGTAFLYTLHPEILAAKWSFVAIAEGRLWPCLVACDSSLTVSLT